MKLVEAFLTKNPCYTAGKKIKPTGLMLHSVGCPQPKASEFISSWNSPSHNKACVHAFIDGNDGVIYQTLPWEHRGWHCASGPKGSGNNSHIGVEMCEPACIKYTSGSNFTCSDREAARAVAKRTYESAVELFAMLCKRYNLDPTADGVILSHREAHERGIASNHGDPEHLWSQLGMSYTMDGFRRDVKEETVSGNKASSEDPGKTVWDYLTGTCGLKDVAAAGVMGNLYAESGLKADNLQNSFEKKLGMSDEVYTACVDSGEYDKESFVNDKAGYGLAQWTYWSRKKALYEFAKANDASIGDMQMQLSFFWKEVSADKTLLGKIQNAGSILEASNAILHDYERPADQSEAVEQKRAGYGQSFYDLYSGKEASAPEEQPSGFSPYLVRVSTAYLNIRRGPGTDYDKVGSYTGIGVFTIVDVESGRGSGKGWGLLKSYEKNRNGWISLDFVERV